MAILSTSLTFAAPQIIRTDLIHDQETALCPDIVVAGNGDIIATFETVGDARPGSRGLFVRSTDGGKTWSNVYLTRKADNETTQGLIVSSMVRRSSDDAILMCQTVLANRLTVSLEVFISDDHGLSFSQFSSVPYEPKTFSVLYGPMVELPNGDMLLPGFVQEVGNGYWTSDNGGKSWSGFRKVWQDPLKGAKQSLWFNETSYVVCDDGQLVAVARNDHDKIFYMIKSDDLGQSWSAPKALPLTGGSPILHRMANGDLLLAYRDAGRPGLSLAISPDHGEHWRYAYTMPWPKGVARLHASHWTRPGDDQHWQPLEGHFGYPGLANLSDGTVYLVWHVFNRHTNALEKREPFSLAGAVLSNEQDKMKLNQENVFTASQIGTLLRGQKRTGPPAVAQLIQASAQLGMEITPLRIENRNSPQAEIHANEVDIFYVLEGEATFHLGGTLDQPRTYSPGNQAGKGKLNSRSYVVGKGDVIVVPRGVVHRITCPDGFVELLVIKQFDDPQSR